MSRKDIHPISKYRKLRLDFARVHELAAVMGMNSFSRISHWEAGYYAPNEDEIARLAHVFKMRPGKLGAEVKDWHDRNPGKLRTIEAAKAEMAGG